MNAPRLRLAWLLAVLLSAGCASTSSDAGDSGKASGGGKAHAADAPAKKDKASAPTTAKKPAKPKPDAVARRDGAGTAKEDVRPPGKAVAAETPRNPAKPKSSKPAPSMPPKPAPTEATIAADLLAKAVADEKTHDAQMRHRYGVSTDIDLAGLLSRDEAEEASRRRKAVEAARLRLAATSPAARPATAEAKPLALKTADAATAASPTGDATARLPSVPAAGATPAPRTPTAFRLGEWLTDDKEHQAWREKRLAKLTEAKDETPPAPPAK
ncbi:MAG: hypothetical protein ACKOBS_02160 [Verrucomicrobiota bacterium]